VIFILNVIFSAQGRMTYFAEQKKVPTKKIFGLALWLALLFDIQQYWESLYPKWIARWNAFELPGLLTLNGTDTLPLAYNSKQLFNTVPQLRQPIFNNNPNLQQIQTQ